jgi:hypothetical protein
MSPQAIELAKTNYACVCSAYGGANYVNGEDRDCHVQRYPHPDSVWELELAVQTILRFEADVRTCVGSVDSHSDSGQEAFVASK